MKVFHNIRIKFIFLGFLTLGCLNQEPIKPLAQHLSKKLPNKILYVINGGLACDIFMEDGTGKGPKTLGIYEQFIKFVAYHREEIATGKKDYILSCFGAGDLNKVDYLVSSKVEKRYYTEHDTYYRTVSDIINNHPNHKVYFVGHSYGGWLSMKTILAIKDNIKRKIDGLITIDPISVATCQFSSNANYIINRFLSGKFDLSGSDCNSAPKDITIDEKKTIASAVKFWHNHYQEEFYWLHSSTIQEATVNIKQSLPWYRINEHAAIDETELPWELLRAKVFEQESGTPYPNLAEIAPTQKPK